MKKKLLLLWTFLLCFAAGSFAGETEVALNGPMFSTSDDGQTYVATSGDFTFTLAQGSSSNAISGGVTSTEHLRVYKGATFTISSAKSITKVAITSTGSSYKTSGFTTSVGSYTAPSTTSGIWEGAENSITFVAEGNQVRISKLVITTSDEGVAVVNPTISGNTSFYGSTEVTLACATEGAAIYYTLDGTDPTTSSTQYTAPFTITESTNVKAIAALDGAVSGVVSKAFVALTAYSTIAELNALENNTQFAFSGSVVVVASEGKYTYIKDATGNSLIYNSGKTFEVGSVIAPTWTGKVSIYNSLFEVVPTSELTAVEGQTETVEYPEATAADVTLENANKVVVLKGVTYTAPEVDSEGNVSKNFTITQGESTIAGYNSIGITIDAPVDGKTYDIVGAISRYKDTPQFAPISITEAVAAEPETAVWRDFQVDLTAQGLLTEDEFNNKTQVEFGIKVAEDGTVSRVAADDATANAVISGKYHNDHGWTGVKVVIPVSGPTKIGVGNCTYSGHTVKVSDANGNAVASFGIPKTGCWSRNKTDEYVTFGYYKGEATTLTIESSSYTPCFSVKKVALEDIPTVMKVEYSLGDTGAAGVLPSNFEINDGEKFATPVNTTLYVEGKTLTGWTDGTKTYAVGEEITAVADTKITLAPVFSANEASLADRTEAVTIKWNFRRDQGANVIGIEGKTGFFVSQAVVNGKTIDVKMDIDATSGKFNNQGHNDWSQVNSGTIFTIPACKGAVIGYETFSATVETTIAGEAINQETTTPTYTYNGTAETVDIVVKDGSYYRSVQVVLPVVAAEEPSTWKDIKVDVYTLVTDEEKTEGTEVNFGIAVDEEGNATRVAADATNANAVFSGKYHSDHGFTDSKMVVKVEGPVKVGIGNCTYGGHTAKFTTAESVTTEFETDAACFKNDATEVTYVYYKGEATTLTINGAGYTRYFSVEKVALEDIPSNMKVTYAIGESGATGVAPAGAEIADGKTFAIPVNKTLYVEGKTLTGWTDGTKTYAIGEEVTAVAGTQMDLTPVFTANEVALADRTEAVTLKWDFQQKNGAPIVAWQNTTGHVWVAQAIIGGKTIDVKCDISTSPGKVANANWNDWAQINEGTTITIPSCKGAVVSVEAYNALGTGDKPLTIDGQSDYTSAQTISYEIANKAETIDVVFGNEGSYYRYVQVVLPVVEGDAPVIQERAIINTGFEDWGTVGADGGTLDIATQFSNETIKFTFVGTSCQPTGQNTGKFGDETGYMMAEKDKQGNVETSVFKNITRVRYKHGATGGNRGWALQKKSANDADWVTLSTDYANPASGVWVEKEINEDNVQLRWYNLTDNQNAYMFNLEVYANVEITAKQVALTTAVSPEEAAGSVNVYPVSTSYDEGTELKMTATENFGYDFVNWTNSAGEELSTEPVFTYTINADETLTANFKKVDTYELAVTVEGGANDYMIALNPAPTIVDGKNMYEAGAVVELSASSNPILTFANWADGQTNGTISVTMDANQSVTAVYSAADYIVGWDFIKRGNNGRPADFASTVDNETAALVLTTAEGKVSGWLDKSKEAANGYESFVGAAVNWQAFTDKYYYQTKINASEFMNIKVQAEMMYNYNAYQKQLIEYSIDGTTWTTVGEATMPGVKTGTPISATLPAEANNATELYIRFIPDYTSNVDGTESNNDGTTITNIFIFGEKKIVDDGVAPKFVSSVPANDATGASATGKIVLNFDEKVKLTDATSATLNGKAIEGSVAGKTVTFPYVGLEYNTQYSFVLAAGSVADLTDNTLAETITVNFTTMNRPSVAKAEYDAVVTNIDELKAALNKATGSARFRIFLHDGTYDFGTATLTNVKGNVSLIGESTEGTILRNDPQAEGIGVTAILCTGGENIYMQDLTLMSTDYERPGNNGEGGSIGRCVVLQENASKAMYKDVNLLSHQDTYYTRATQRTYWEGGKIAGTVDYLCGGGDIFFNGVTLYNNARSNGDCITAPATSSNWGYVFSNCTIDGDEGQDGQYSLGRPWQGSPRAVYLNTTMKILPTGAGWSDMGTVPGLFAEYNSHTESGALVDCSARKTTFSFNGTSQTVTYNPVLTQAEAEKYTIASVVGGSDNWQPELYTEQAPAPTNVIIDGTTLAWDNSEYALLWAVCKDGKVVAFTTEPTYTVDDATAKWSVRAANEMGGLCDAIEAVAGTVGIENIEQAVDDNAPMYNVAGQRVTKSMKGIVIQNGRKYVRK